MNECANDALEWALERLCMDVDWGEKGNDPEEMLSERNINANLRQIYLIKWPMLQIHLRLQQLINRIDNDNKQQTISYAVNT